MQEFTRKYEHFSNKWQCCQDEDTPENSCKRVHIYLNAQASPDRLKIMLNKEKKGIGSDMGLEDFTTALQLLLQIATFPISQYAQ